jgi:hypothetical protein
VSSTTTTTASALRPNRIEPAYGDAALTARFNPLFATIVQNKKYSLQPLFFPEAVYVNMKKGILPKPAQDYNFRLLAFFSLDISAYYHHLGSSPATASLVNVHAAAHSAQWIPAGTCENNFGYWHLANVRLVYNVGAIKSVAIASLISWRGQWYVIHLGPNPRPSNVGTVALPANGPGTPGPQGGC